MAKLEIHRVPVLRDNYVWLAHEASSNLTAAVDPAVVDPVLAALDVQGWSLTHILNTHHHHDHTGNRRWRLPTIKTTWSPKDNGGKPWASG